MSIRINQETLAGNSVSETSRAEELHHSTQNGSKPTSGLGSLGGDQVTISSLSGSITDTLATAAARQSSKVQHLAALYASGRYHADSEHVSRALVSQSITSPTAKSGQ